MDRFIQNADVCLNEWDHRRVGRDLELFSFHEEGPGLPFFLPRGVALKNQLIDYWRSEHQSAGYHEIQSPILLDCKLWEKSGHWDLFKENMYISKVDKRKFALKPMNCPGAILHYQEKRRSHSELPYRVCEMGQVHRDEVSGALHGLLRVRSFVIDDGHIFCAKEQLASEVQYIMQLSLKILRRCGFKEFQLELSIRSEEKKDKYLGSDKEWDYAESVLEKALQSSGLDFQRMPGEAKFYGPAIDLKLKDSSGRYWQCSALQMDFNLPLRFDLSYFDELGQRKRPYILHRCIYGSLERFMGVLLEHHRGNLPIWLAPEQARLISVSNRGRDWLAELSGQLRAEGVRLEEDFSEDHISQKVKRAEHLKVPIMILAGDREVDSGKYSVRLKEGQQKNLLHQHEVLRLFK